MRSLPFHRTFRLVASVTLAATVFVGCSSGTENDPPKAAGTAPPTAVPASAARPPRARPRRAGNRGGAAARAGRAGGRAGRAPRATGPATQPADAYAWPREFDAGGDHYAIYQPQVERWENDALEARAAVAVTRPGSPDADYGIITLTARTEVEKDIRMVTLDQIAITKAEFPQAKNKEPVYLGAMRDRAAAATREVPLDHLEANVAMTKARKADAVAAVAVKNDPPKIIFATTPTLLMIIDGQPTMREVKEVPGVTGLMRVVNTRALILFDKQSEHVLPARC